MVFLWIESSLQLASLKLLLLFSTITYTTTATILKIVWTTIGVLLLLLITTLVQSILKNMMVITWVLHIASTNKQPWSSKDWWGINTFTSSSSHNKMDINSNNMDPPRILGLHDRLIITPHWKRWLILTSLFPNENRYPNRLKITGNNNSGLRKNQTGMIPIWWRCHNP